MRVFLTGANGWVGSVVARDLIDAGHTVTGLVRSREKADALAASGVTPLLGSLSDLDVLRAGADDADGVIHTAFGLDLSKIKELAKEDVDAIETFGDVFAGSDRPIVVTGGVGLDSSGKTFTEDARPPVFSEFRARRSRPPLRSPSGGCAHRSSGSRGLSMARASVTASFPCSAPSPVRRASRPISETGGTSGLR